MRGYEDAGILGRRTGDGQVRSECEGVGGLDPIADMSDVGRSKVGQLRVVGKVRAVFLDGGVPADDPTDSRQVPLRKHRRDMKLVIFAHGDVEW